MATLIGLKRCSTCRDVEKTLEEKNIEYDYRHIDKDTPSAEEVRSYHEKSGLDINKFFNSSGKRYRELDLKNKKDTMSDQEKYVLLSSDGMLIKRPILLIDDKVLVSRPSINDYLNNR